MGVYRNFVVLLNPENNLHIRYRKNLNVIFGSFRANANLVESDIRLEVARLNEKTIIFLGKLKFRFCRLNCVLNKLLFEMN